ncbi:MAG: TonB-dependent receptor plug domain-containing protein [Opitutaceae bacterium]|nr:TonB-dependent receptor plug domain-containing protein [Opitutaceae bacterium]
MHLPKKILLLAITAVALGARVPAQETPGASSDEIIRLDRYVVTGVPVAQSVNPLTRDISTVFGDARSILDTPRAVSSITEAMLNERGIHGVKEFVVYSPGTYAPSSYGLATTPNIRGDTAETYLNGQRRSYNLYGFLPSWNGIEAIDIVRGPGSAVFGAGFFSGGYVNYVTKQPKFSGPATVVTTRLGTWAPGHVSYFNASVAIDTTAPVSDKLAWRVSYEGKGGDTFFRKNGVDDDRQDIFAALSWRPAAGRTFELNAQWEWQNWPEILGVNRVSQELIDRATYYTGISPDLFSGPGPINVTGKVTLPWEASLFSTGDYSNANAGHVQLISTFVLSPAFKLVNRTLAEHIDRHRYNQSEYAEYVKQTTVENRTEAHLNFDFLDHAQQGVGGFTLRYEGRESFTNYFNEYLYNFDVTDPARTFDQAAQYPNSYFPGFPGPGGHLFFPNSYDSPETVISSLWNPALFWQHQVALTAQLSLLVGLREDWFIAKARDPYEADTGVPYHDSATVASFSNNVNLIWRPTAKTSFYAAYQRVRAANGNNTGGGVLLNAPDGTINDEDFRNLSKLAEVGVKFSLRDNKLFAGATLFDQQRSRVSLGGKKSNIVVRGLELEAVYQPDTQLNATFNATFQNGHYIDSRPFQMGGRSIYAAYLIGQGPGGKGTSTGSFNPYGNQVPNGDWPLLGFSKVILNGSVRYRFDSGFGVGAGAQYGSRQTGNLDDEWHIPAQYLINASLFYETKRWTVNLDLLNLTQQRNWYHNGDAFSGSILIFSEQPFRTEGYVKYRF